MIITCVGSMKHRKLICLLSKEFMSNIEDCMFYTPDMVNGILGYDKSDIGDIEIKNLNNRHKNLIKISDYVLVIDYSVGESTHEEYLYAKSLGKCIIKLSEILKYFDHNKDIIDNVNIYKDLKEELE